MNSHRLKSTACLRGYGCVSPGWLLRCRSVLAVARPLAGAGRLCGRCDVQLSWCPGRLVVEVINSERPQRKNTRWRVSRMSSWSA